MSSLAPTPPRLERRRVGGPPMESLQVRLQTTTPLLGGAPEPRQVDKVDIIRGPTVRGHLRFWWRALHGHACATPEELALRERALWGGVGGKQSATRSQVEVRVELEQRSDSDDEDIHRDSPGAYVLWVASAQKRGRVVLKPPVPRLKPGLRFRLHLRVPRACMTEVENALRAWILWGGYGGRTRRGLGGLTVLDELRFWLPSNPPTRDELRKLFHALPLLGAPPAEGGRQVPLLQGARLFHGPRETTALRAWTQAVGWLRDFRQQEAPGGPTRAATREADGPSRFARAKGSLRPGRSFWPEADKVRLLRPKPEGGSWAHRPRSAYASSKEVAWPRAGFGLPLAMRFQKKTAQGEPYREGEPEEVELRWHDGQDIRERFASPLIVKAMPLADGGFVPIALWLCRAWPPASHVVLLPKGQRKAIVGSESPFERLLAPGDTALYAPLQASSLAESFFTWVRSQGAKES